MPQRRGKSKPLDANTTEDPVFDALDSSTTYPSITKRTREPDADDVSTQANKRPKKKGTVELDSYSPTVADTQGQHTNEPAGCPPSEVRRWQDKYEIVAMSILSSSKIEQKVRNLLLRLSKVDYENTKAKPRVVKLHAKGDVAGKMVSIIEIAKAEIRKENGKLYQYNGLHGETSELKVKKLKRTGSGNGVAEGTKEHAEPEDPSGETINKSDKCTLGTVDQSDDDPDMIDATEDAFETMAPLSRGHVTPAAKKKVRAYPILTIYLSRVPILELKDLHGYAWYHLLLINI